MPGSLLLGADTHSNVSEYSGRSLDSKIGGKKVSFNKAVKVKQYSGRPNVTSSSDHMTLPSNRFWFRVYKNEHDTPVSYEYLTGTSKQNAWEEENTESVHDSLAPIAEVDDVEIDTSPKIENNGLLKRYPSPSEDDTFNEYNGSYKPTDPPIDYFEEMRLNSNRSARRVWEENELKSDRPDYDKKYTSPYNRWNDNNYNNRPYMRIDENSESPSLISDRMGLSRSNPKSDYSTRRSMRRMDESDNFLNRERRSRSHDEYRENDNFLKHLKKADKSVSTDDLNNGNSHNISNNTFFKGSRDIATQCYGTLSRNNKPFIASQTNSFSDCNQRLQNFKTQRSRSDFSNDVNSDLMKSPRKDYSLQKLSSVIRPRKELSNFSNQRDQNFKQFSQKPQLNGKMNNEILKPLIRTEDSIENIMQKQNKQTFNRVNSNREFNSIGMRNNRENTSQYGSTRKASNIGFNRFDSKTEYNSMNNRENSNHNSTSKEANGVGYLRGHQIPLSEVNTNTNRKFLSKNNNSLTPTHVPRKADENHSRVKLPNVTLKPDFSSSNGCQTKRHLSPSNNYERRSFRNSSHSAKSYSSSFNEGGSSMIDWSLSGFQLAPKPENSINSVSDSEYTVHRRPPLLMYIPGVSHHDRPAIEDDRLSALSDTSRYESNDGLSSLAGSTNDRSLFGDFRRRQSMREGKSKWMKWRSKS